MTAGSTRWSFRWIGAAAVIALAWSASLDHADAQSMSDYFRGKTLRILVPSAPGGDRALYPTMFAPFFAKHIPGNPTVQPVFMPGAGGSTAVNNAYGIAAPDGLTLVTPLVAVVSAQAIGDESVKYDVAKMNWIGRISDRNPLEHADHLSTAQSSGSGKERPGQNWVGRISDHNPQQGAATRALAPRVNAVPSIRALVGNPSRLNR